MHSKSVVSTGRKGGECNEEGVNDVLGAVGYGSLFIRMHGGQRGEGEMSKMWRPLDASAT